MQALLSVCMQDEEAELLAELERIKKEREEVASKRAAEEASAAASSLQEELIRGNPLIIGKFDKSADFQVRCRIGAYFERNLDILLDSSNRTSLLLCWCWPNFAVLAFLCRFVSVGTMMWSSATRREARSKLRSGT